MNASLLSELRAQLECEIRFDVPLARYTTYRIGGPAAALVMPRSTADVRRVLWWAKETGTPWLALGLGSNVLIGDRGFDGVVLRVGRGLDRCQAGVGSDPQVWSVGAGLPTPLLARRTARAGLGGVHRLIGVPGSVGGGVFMNAGAHGQEFRQVVREVELVDGAGGARTVPTREIAWRYRGSGLEGNLVVGATLTLVPGDPEELGREIRQHFRWRRAGTPFDEPCCGSVFRNPGPASGQAQPPRTAGQLIDGCGLKGFRIGGAEVSPKHANYIVNQGGATAADVRAVIDTVRQRVLERFGVELELEVRIIGE